ncbi:DUF547 domain-containing protein [Thaumasiovibrio sp. DFM-14]|uniref:DUF547 domain-containing protein n=1 Tax=Thaumasiovibrio sp. DFM-14 TaxID=3384792 RepID=UPI00399F5D59
MKGWLIVLYLVAALPVCAAPRAELWPIWTSANAHNSAQIDHRLWQQTLDEYLEVAAAQTRFDYRQYLADNTQWVAQYLTAMANIDPRMYRREEQLAFWINLYNAQTVQLILEEYPLDSITELGGVFSFGPWNEEVIEIAGEPLSLNDIEHRILRPIWQDARIHYAVNCASLGCPDLLAESFTANNSEQLLERAATRFINSDKGVYIDGERALLSSIFDWYAKDFTPDVKTHINRYRQGKGLDGHKIGYDYDWALNER